MSLSSPHVERSQSWMPSNAPLLGNDVNVVSFAPAHGGQNNNNGDAGHDVTDDRTVLTSPNAAYNVSLTHPNNVQIERESSF